MQVMEVLENWCGRSFHLKEGAMIASQIKSTERPHLRLPSIMPLHYINELINMTDSSRRLDPDR